MANYNILSFDGGGLRGVFSAQILARLAQEVEGLVAKSSMVAGTSTGSIIAVALAQGMEPADIVAMYQKIGPPIFVHNFLQDLEHAWGLSHSKYTTEARLGAFNANLKDVPLQNLNKDIVVVSFDLGADTSPNPNQQNWKPKVYHNMKGPDSDG